MTELEVPILLVTTKVRERKRKKESKIKNKLAKVNKENNK